MFARASLVAVVVVVLVTGSALYVSLPTLLNTTSPSGSGTSGGSTPLLSFQIVNGLALFDSETGRTNVTIVLRNDGNVPIRLGGINGFHLADPFVYVAGSFQAYFYSADGTRLQGLGHGVPPDTANGGEIRATFLVTGAKVGDVITVSPTFTLDSLTATQATIIVVLSGQGSTTTLTTSTSTSSTTSSTSSASTTSITTYTTVGTATTTSTTSTTASTTSTTSGTSTTTTTSSATSSTLSFYFESATAVYNSTSHETNVSVTLKDTGSISLKPSYLKDVVPPGTSLVAGTWLAYFYAADGSFICYIPQHCSSPPDTSNGGRIRVTFLVTKATVGEMLTLTYTFTQQGLTATDSTTFIVT